MATASMINDEKLMNRIDPFTETNTFGTPTNGGFYDGPDGTYTTQIDETPMELNDPNDDLSHFTPDRVNRSGPIMVNESAPTVAPFLGFPARKFEYPETFYATWYRPGLEKMPVPSKINKVCGKPEKQPFIQQIKNIVWGGHMNKDQDIIILIMFVVLVIYVFR